MHLGLLRAHDHRDLANRCSHAKKRPDFGLGAAQLSAPPAKRTIAGRRKYCKPTHYQRRKVPLLVLCGCRIKQVRAYCALPLCSLVLSRAPFECSHRCFVAGRPPDPRLPTVSAAPVLTRGGTADELQWCPYACAMVRRTGWLVVASQAANRRPQEG